MIRFYEQSIHILKRGDALHFPIILLSSEATTSFGLTKDTVLSRARASSQHKDYLLLTVDSQKNRAEPKNDVQLKSRAIPELTSRQITFVWAASFLPTFLKLFRGISRLPLPRRICAEAQFFGPQASLFSLPSREGKAGNPPK